MKVFLDTNVVIDVLTLRHPFYEDSAKVCALATLKEIEAHVSAVSFTNAHYVVRKMSGNAAAEQAVRRMASMFQIVACDRRTIDGAIDGDIRDFEDGVQHQCALACGAERIITRNADDFSGANLIVQTPSEFLTWWKREGSPTR